MAFHSVRSVFSYCAAMGSLLIVILDATAVRASAPADQMHLPAGARIGDYVGEDVMIPMRDGVRLHAEVWRPRDATGKLPILMQRSPYGFGLARVGKSFDAEYKELAKDGFIFVLEDIRGRFGSEGDFVMLRPRRPWLETSPMRVFMLEREGKMPRGSSGR